MGGVQSQPLELTQNDDEKEVEAAKRARRAHNARKSIAITPGALKRHRSALVPASAAFTPRSRRLSRGRRVSVGPASAVGRSPFTPGEMAQSEEIAREMLSEAELSEVYANAIRLMAAGKINQNNVWTLNLIDYIDDVIRGEDDANVSMFQKASRTLDASVKIYSCRVDSVHSLLYRVLGGLNRSDKRGDGDMKDGGDEDGDGAGNGRRRAARPKGHGDTLVKAEKIESINVTSHDLNYEVDPMFFKMASKFDESGAKGLLLNSLQVHNGTEIAFDSDVQLREKTEAEKEEKEQEVDADEDAGVKDEVDADADEKVEEKKEDKPPADEDEDDDDLPPAPAQAPKEETDEQLYGDTAAQLDALGDLWRAIDKPMQQIPICKTLSTFKRQTKVYEARIETLKQRADPEARRNSVAQGSDEPERLMSFSDSEDDLDDLGGFVFTSSSSSSSSQRQQLVAPRPLMPLLPPGDDDFGDMMDDGGFGDHSDDDGPGGGGMGGPAPFSFMPPEETPRGNGADGNAAGARLQDAINQEAAMREDLREDDDDYPGAAGGGGDAPAGEDIQRNFLNFADMEPAVFRNWAGPTHWKYKRPQRTEESKQKQKKKEKKTEFLDLLDFKNEVDEDFFAPPKKGSNCLSKQVLAKNKERTFDLPEDLHLSVDFLHKLFMNPNMRMGRKKQGGGGGGFGRDDDGRNMEVHWYNYANKNDEQFVADVGRGRDGARGDGALGDVGVFNESMEFNDSGPDDDDGGDVGLGSFDAGGAALDLDLQFDDEAVASNPLLSGALAEAGGGLKLVDAPDKVKQVDVKYSTTAKRVDVRNLKSKLWMSLQTEESRDFDQKLRDQTNKSKSSKDRSSDAKDEHKHEDPAARMNDDEQEDQENVDPVKEKVPLNTFQDSISRLSDVIPKQALDVVSVPYCFICVLHLANEKNLQFTTPTDDPDSDDFLGNFTIDRASGPADPATIIPKSPPSKGSIRSYFPPRVSASKA